MLKIYKPSCPNKRLWMSIERLSSGDKMTMMVVEENRVGVKKVMFVVDIRQFGSWQAEAGGQDGLGRAYISF